MWIIDPSGHGRAYESDGGKLVEDFSSIGVRLAETENRDNMASRGRTGIDQYIVKQLGTLISDSAFLQKQQRVTRSGRP